MDKENARIEELKAEIIELVCDFAVQNPHIQSPLVLRGLELKKLENKKETTNDNSNQKSK